MRCVKIFWKSILFIIFLIRVSQVATEFYGVRGFKSATEVLGVLLDEILHMNKQKPRELVEMS